ncbi:hypothetical protein AMJ47_00440 [Parcubacteria bacterium DG_72]|nr:MAG: hypothetical protein AMJ47_00440 [Parcubacteria bacterium DG_72]
MNIIAIIPARGGSKGLQKKNINLLNGKPLIAHTILAAKECSLINRVIVSTDDEEIASVAKEYGAEVPFLRPAELAQDNTPTEPVLEHCVKWLEDNENYKTDIAVYLQLTDVFRHKGVIKQVVEKIIANPELDTVFTLTETRKNYWRNKDNQWLRLANDIPPYGPRQKKPPLFREDTGLACATKAEFIKQGKRVGEKVDAVENKSDFWFMDIHEETDLWLAETVIQKLKEKDQLKNYEIF